MHIQHQKGMIPRTIPNDPNKETKVRTKYINTVIPAYFSCEEINTFFLLL